MKRIKVVLFLAFMILFSQVSVYAGAHFEIKLPEYKFTVNDEPLLDFPFLSINGEYYAPITEMAEFFGYHTEIDQNNAYTINFIEGNSKDAKAKQQKLFQFVQNTNRRVEVSKYQIVCNGYQMETTLLTVDGYHFVKLKDATDFFGMYIYTDDKNKVVDFSTNEDVFREMNEEERMICQEYLSKNVMPIDLNNLTNQALMKDAGLDQYNVILFGENHAIAKNINIELFLIKYLNKNMNIRHIFIEYGYCNTQLLNRYLDTGDLSVLENMMDSFKGTFVYSLDMYQFYKDLYEYNQSLPKDKRLEFIGVDIQYQTNTGIDYIISLLPKTPIPELIKKDIDTLLLTQEKKAYQMETLESLLKSLEDHKVVYEQYLGKEYDHFKFGLTSIVQLFECDKVSDEEFMNLREKKIIKNFTSQYDKIDHARCFGIFGAAHTILNSYSDSRNREYNLATYISTKYDQTKDKVGSIRAMYLNSYYMDNRTGESIKIKSQTFEKLLGDTTASDYSLFPLDAEDAIFVKDGSTQSQKYLLYIKNSPQPQQYLLLIKNSPAATPYNKK